MEMSNISRTIILATTLLGLSQASVLVNPVTLECIDESAIYQSTYHAPPRATARPDIADRQLKLDFLALFRREFQKEHEHKAPEDPPPLCPPEDPPNPLSAEVLAELNSRLPRSDTFQSFTPGGTHLETVRILMTEFNKARSPLELYGTVLGLLHSHSINHRLWYHALVAVLITRPDLSSIILPRAIDVTPDNYVTYTILKLAREGSKHNRESKTETCTTSTGLVFQYLNFTSPRDELQVKKQDERPLRGKRGLKPYGVQQVRDPCDRTVIVPEPVKVIEPVTYLPYTVTYVTKKKWKPYGYQSGYHGYYDSYQPTGVIYDDKWKRNHHHQSYNNPFVDVLLSPPLDVLGSRSKRSNIGAPSTSKNNLRKVKKRDANPEQCILYNGTKGATGDENRLWYFREDMSLNEHHWYWHQHYTSSGPQQPDRHGELFFFAHHSIQARYNAERLSNGLDLVTPLEFYAGADIGSGYNSDLLDEFTGRFWTPRLANTPLSDFESTNLNEVANAFSTLRLHVAQGYLLSNRSKEGPLPLNIKNQEGVSHLGITAEGPSRHSVNRDLYQSVHVLGHQAISVSTDPDNKCGQLLDGIMRDVEVAMRDPSFYRVHALVDTLYSKHKATLPPYQLHGGEWPLQWDGVRLQSVEVVSDGGKKNNFLKTFWALHKFRLEEGVDGLIHEGEVQAHICHQHLNHEPFMFKLVIDMDSCAKTVSKRGTVRLFLAPRYNLEGRRFTMEETRTLMFQLDAFPVELRRGRNTITRNSQDSSTTKPWSRTLQQLLDDPDNGNRPEYCGCGWPRHLYIPKGTPQGMEFDLFAMVTDFDQDTVIDSPEDSEIKDHCISPYTYCGRPNKKYPDARPMGYPFDRLPYSVLEVQKVLRYEGYLDENKVLRPVSSLEEYVAHVPNMRSSVLVIQHEDMIIQ